MAIKNSVSSNIWSAFVDSTCINIFDRRLSSVFKDYGIIPNMWQSQLSWMILPDWLPRNIIACMLIETKVKNGLFSTKTHVVGTQKNRLNEMVLLST